MLERFDLVNLLRDVNGDDSFYYFQIAYNMAEGKFSTFDGGITETNGYHPLWLFMIVPFYWVFDKETALFAIKAFEIMLVASGVSLVAVAARLARLPYILLLAVLPALYEGRYHLYLIFGMEAAAVLFVLALLFLALVLYARDPRRWVGLLATIAFLLPWVRLEYIAISLAATAALCLIEWSGQDRPPGAPFKTHVPKAAVPFLAACASISVYFAYNRIVFGGLVPVSGATKQVWSQIRFEREGGYSFARNFWDVLQISAFDYELLVALEICAYLLLVWWFARHSKSEGDWLLLAFLAGVFGLAAGHLAKFAQTVLTIHPAWGRYDWYFVPAYLMMALIIPLRCFVAIHLIRRFIGARLPQAANIVSVGIVISGAAFLTGKADFTYPFRWVDRMSESTYREWEITSYMGVQVMDHLLPKDSVIGSWDAGVIGYFSRFPVVNLDGLVNSYDYFRVTTGDPDRYIHTKGTFKLLYREFGITHLANTEKVEIDFDNTLFAGAPYLGGGSENRFRLASANPLEGVDPAAWFWERMEPHFDYSSDDIAVLVDGRLAQAFVRNRAPDELIALSFGQREETVAKGKCGTPELCVDAFVLPHDALPLVSGHLYVGEQFIGYFEDGFDGWLPAGEAVTNYAQHDYYKGYQPIRGNVSRGFLTSYHPDKGNRATGRVLSPAFTAEPGQHLTFLIAGGAGSGVGLRLLANGAEVAVWRGRNTEQFRQVVHPLAAVAGERLWLELFDDETGGWGHIMLDHVMLVRRQSEEQSEKP